MALHLIKWAYRTAIASLQADGDLNQMLSDTLAPIKKLKVTDIYSKDESDFENSTSAKVLESVRYISIMNALARFLEKLNSHQELEQLLHGLFVLYAHLVRATNAHQ